MKSLYATILGCSLLGACASQPQYPIIGQPKPVDKGLIQIVERLEDKEPPQTQKEEVTDKQLVLFIYNDQKKLQESRLAFMNLNEGNKIKEMSAYDQRRSQDEELVRRMQEDAGDKGLGKGEAKEIAVRKLAEAMDRKLGGIIPLGGMTALIYDTKRRIQDYGKICIGDLKGHIHVGGNLSGIDEASIVFEYPLTDRWKFFVEMGTQTNLNDVPDNPIYESILMRENQVDDWVHGRISSDSFDSNTGNSIFFGIKRKF